MEPYFPSAQELNDKYGHNPSSGYTPSSPSSAQQMSFANADDVLTYLKNNAGSDPASRDILFNYFLSEKSASSARAYEREQNSTRYQQMVEDLKKAGLNPYWLNSLGGAATYQGQSNKYSGSAYETAYRNSLTASRQNYQDAKDVMSIVGTVVSAIMLAVALL